MNRQRWNHTFGHYMTGSRAWFADRHLGWLFYERVRTKATREDDGMTSMIRIGALIGEKG